MPQMSPVHGQDDSGRKNVSTRFWNCSAYAVDGFSDNWKQPHSRTGRVHVSARTMIPVLAAMLLVFSAIDVFAAPPRAVSKVPMVMVGDRLVDAAFNLGVLPEGMVIRMSLWPMGGEMAHAAQVLGCPNAVMHKKPKALPTFLKERGITKVLVEKNAKPCLYVDLTYDKIADIVKEVPGVSLEYIDFDQGEVPAIKELAAKLGLEEKGAAVIAAYEAREAKMKTALPAQGLGKRVVVLAGVYSEEVGTKFTRVEAPGGYTDAYILKPLGCVNAADAMIQDPKDIEKGHVMARDLSSLIKANPDVIAITGDAYAVQKTLSDNIKRHPELAKIPALQKGAVYSLPFYANNGVLEYPNILRQWADALKN